MSKILLTQEYVNLLLNKILNNKDYDKSLEEVLLTDDSKVESVSDDDFEYYMYERIPDDIIKYDPSNALKITYDKNINSNTFDFNNLDYESYIEKLVNGFISEDKSIFYGIFTQNKYRLNNYQENKYVILDSSKLFKNVTDINNDIDKDIMLSFNANGKNTFTLLKKLYEQFINEKMPFYMVYRIKDYDNLNLQDNLTLYINHKDLDKIDNIIKNIDDIKDLVRKPSVLFEDNELYGLSYLQNNKTLVELISDVILKTIHNASRDFNDRYNTNLDASSNNVKVIQDNLQIIKDKDNNLYRSITDNIINYLSMLNDKKEFDVLNEIYTYKYNYSKAENKENSIEKIPPEESLDEVSSESAKDLAKKIREIGELLDNKVNGNQNNHTVSNIEQNKDNNLANESNDTSNSENEDKNNDGKLDISWVDLPTADENKKAERHEQYSNDVEDEYYKTIAELKKQPIVKEYLEDYEDEINKLPAVIIDKDGIMWGRENFIDERLVPLIAETNGEITIDEVKDRYIDSCSFKVVENKKPHLPFFRRRKR